MASPHSQWQADIIFVSSNPGCSTGSCWNTTCTSSRVKGKGKGPEPKAKRSSIRRQNLRRHGCTGFRHKSALRHYKQASEHAPMGLNGARHLKYDHGWPNQRLGPHIMECHCAS